MLIEWLTGVSQVVGLRPDMFSCELNLSGFPFIFHGSMKKFNQLAKKYCLKFFLSSIKTKVAIEFNKTNLIFFFPAEKQLGGEMVKILICHQCLNLL